MDGFVQEKEHENHVFSASMFLLFGSDWYMIIELCIATLSSPMSNFRYH
jgi:hypothetical protein